MKHGRCLTPSMSAVVPERVPVFVNRHGGTASARGTALEDELRQAFADAELAIDLHLIDGAQMPQAVKAAAQSSLIVVGGGDGTLGCAAEALVDHGKAALGILPLGTRNHLARELGIPMTLAGAAQVIADGHRRSIDLARVNGRAFINNASIGLYPLMVREREKRDVPKWLAALPAARAALDRLPHHRLHIRMEGEANDVVTPMLFVGNNRYELEMGRVGKRAALDDGTLSVFAVERRGRLALLGFALRTLAGRADPERDFCTMGEAKALNVSSPAHHIDIALDGEVVRLSMPLDFTIQPGALTVIAPAA
jgi:diacylglycerol kinase family enzyme